MIAPELARAILAQISKTKIEEEKPFKVVVNYNLSRYEVGAPEIYTNPKTGVWMRSAAWIKDLGLTA